MDKTELSMNEMEQVSGGTWHTVNTGVSGLDAALREKPCKKSRQIGHIPNGIEVDTVSDQLFYDSDSCRHYVQVQYNGKTGWVASSILGMPR